MWISKWNIKQTEITCKWIFAQEVIDMMINSGLKWTKLPKIGSGVLPP